MPTLFSDILPIVRQRLIEPSPNFWTDSELFGHMLLGAKDMWRSITDLKQEHYLKVDTTSMSLPATPTTTQATPGFTLLSGVPADIHKIVMIEPSNLTISSSNVGLRFAPLKWQDNIFQLARSMQPIDPANDTIYYALHNTGAPINPIDIRCAPQVTSAVPLAVTYVPSLPPLTLSDPNPIPGESDNAIIAWTVAFARAKETQDRSPDPGWLTVYATEKQSVLQSLGLREYQEPSFSYAVYEEYWTLALAAGLSLLPFLHYANWLSV